MNIWIWKIQGPAFSQFFAFGYAYPPADLPNWPDGYSAPSLDSLDGVVIDYRAFGNNPNQFPTIYDFI
ncbi:MAG: hypothetical protein IPN09_17910 [Bacteroidetes bacterium]|nr:hypothetical protein [Bacteroidota bacterium]